MSADLLRLAQRLDDGVRALGRELHASLPPRDPRHVEVQRMTEEARHALLRMVTAADLHPRAGQTESES